MSNKDHKNARGSRASSSRNAGGGGMMAGIIVGLIVGVGIAIGVTMYLSRSATPFTNLERMQGKQTASLPEAELLEPGGKLATVQPPVAKPDATLPPKASAPVGRKPEAPSTNTPVDADGQRFDFYKILPGQQDAVPAPDKGTADVASGSNSAGQRFFLQAGAFQSESDADNMKARLALMGVEAKIQSLNVADKGLMHRVRIGPFERQEELDSLRGKLRQEGIDVSVVKLPVK